MKQLPFFHRLSFVSPRFWAWAVMSTFATFQTAAQTSMPLDLDNNGTPDFLNITTTSGSVVFPGIAAHVEVFDPASGGSAITAMPLEPGTVVNSDTGWGAQNWSVGYAGIRFTSAQGTHYGWMELANPWFMGRPSFQMGGWATRYYFNPEPNQPMVVGDTTLKLSLSFDAATGKLRLKWNTDASQWPTGLRIQSRPIGSTAGWALFKGVSIGTETEIDVGQTGRVFRAVHD